MNVNVKVIAAEPGWKKLVIPEERGPLFEEHVIAWFVELGQVHKDPNRLYAIVEPITPEGTPGPAEHYALRAPDGRVYLQAECTFDSEKALASYLDEQWESKATPEARAGSPRESRGRRGG